MSAVYQQMLASAAGGCLVAVTLNPLLILKVHLQRSDKGKGAGLTEGGISPNLRNKTGSDLRAIISSVVKKRGIRGFWAGTPLGLAQTVPSTVLYFTTFEKLKSVIYASAEKGSTIALATPGIAGALARTLVVSIIAPIELMRTVQTSGIGLTSTQLANNIYKRQGVGGFYRGWFNTVLRDSPFSFIYWIGFDQMKKQISGQTVLPAPVANFAVGSVSAAFATVTTHPFDVLKTNQQVNIVTSVRSVEVAGAGGGVEGAAAAAAPVPKTMHSCSSAPELFRQGGLPVMFRGLSMRLMTIIPGSAIMVTVYEHMKSMREAS
jgi:solute carrier family 25, member 39/40